MKNKLTKEKIEGVFILIIMFLIIGGFFWILSYGARKMDEDRSLRQKQKQEFIEQCITNGGVVEQIGNWMTENYLICQLNKHG